MISALHDMDCYAVLYKVIEILGETSVNLNCWFSLSLLS